MDISFITISTVNLYNGNAYWMGNGNNYHGFPTRAVIFKTDFSLNGVNMCYELNDGLNNYTVEANTISVWKDISTYEPMVAFNLANGPFLETITFSLIDQDISNVYPKPDTTGNCQTPPLDPLVFS